MTDALRRRFFALALPNVVSNLLVPLSGLVDVAMLGHFGGIDDLAGVALGTVLFDYILWSMGFLRMGTTGLSAQAMGRGDDQGALDIFARGLGVALVAGAVLVLLRGPLAGLGFSLLEGAAEVKAAAHAYYDARIWGAPIALGAFVVYGFLLGLGRGRAVLILSVANNLTNMVLDYVLIARLDMGAAGAGYATVASHAATCVCGIPLVLSAAHHQGLRLRLQALRNLREVRAFLQLGKDILVRTLALLTSFALFTDFSAVLGTERLASNALVLKVVTLSAYFVDGYAFSVESLAGQLYGAGEPSALRYLLRLAGRYGLLTGACFATLFQAFPGALFGLLTDHPGLLATAEQDVVWLWPILLAGSLAYVLDGFFLGLSAGPVLSRMMLLSLGLGFLPLAIYARARASSDWLWFALTCFILARVITLGANVPRTLRALSPRGPAPADQD